MNWIFFIGIISIFHHHFFLSRFFQEYNNKHNKWNRSTEKIPENQKYNASYSCKQSYLSRNQISKCDDEYIVLRIGNSTTVYASDASDTQNLVFGLYQMYPWRNGFLSRLFFIYAFFSFSKSVINWRRHFEKK